ncbi:MAG: plastocyanin/azurin family copper-binding protein [Candidatus Limnocylindrales bacterium]
MERLRRPAARLAALAFVLSLVSVGCTEASAAAPIVIRIHYSRFIPEAVQVPYGEPVLFEIHNDDPIDHEWIVGDAALHARHRTGTEPSHGDRPTEQSIPALGMVRTTVTFEAPGDLQYICHLPGHEAYGMVGLLTVAAASS